MTSVDNIKTIVVIGAGTMGREIAQVSLMGGFESVILFDINKEALNNAVDFIKRGISKMEAKGKLGEGILTIDLMEKLIIETDMVKAVKDADFVIEAVPEIMKLKQEIFEKLGKFAPEHAILTTNTSTMSISEISSTSGREHNVVGMHFFTPIPVLRLIEIIKGKKTSDNAIEITVAVGKKLPALKGKRVLPIIQKESPGFIVNRLTIACNLYINWLLDYAVEKDIPFEQIDADIGDLQEFGPFTRLDYLGLDVVYNVMKYFENAISYEFTPGKTLTKCVSNGNLGKKTGRGLFEWKNGMPVRDKSVKAGIFNTEIFLAIQLNEGCRLLIEEIVSDYREIDDAMMAGMNMPGPFGPGKRNYVKWAKMLEDFVIESNIQYLKPCELMKSGGFLKMRK